MRLIVIAVVALGIAIAMGSYSSGLTVCNPLEYQTPGCVSQSTQSNIALLAITVGIVGVVLLIVGVIDWSRGQDRMGTPGADDPAVRPGWYVDPSDVRQLRWWDGTTWTPHVAPRQPTTGPPWQ